MVAKHEVPQPQAIFVLGGDLNRSTFAARLWQDHKELDIWVSDFPYYLDAHRKIFCLLDVPESKLRLDGRATDTVTNFTTLVKEFSSHRIKHLYLVTSSYHMKRAKAIATVILGSHGIVTTPIAVPASPRRSESLLRIIRDVTRSILWIFTGRTGASLNPNINS